MTPAEYEVLRLKVKILAQEFAIEWLCGMLETNCKVLLPDELPRVEEIIQDRIVKARQESEKLAFSEFPPEYSDMYSAEFQEASNSVLDKLAKALKFTSK